MISYSVESIHYWSGFDPSLIVWIHCNELLKSGVPWSWSSSQNLDSYTDIHCQTLLPNFRKPSRPLCYIAVCLTVTAIAALGSLVPRLSHLQSFSLAVLMRANADTLHAVMYPYIGWTLGEVAHSWKIASEWVYCLSQHGPWSDWEIDIGQPWWCLSGSESHPRAVRKGNVPLLQMSTQHPIHRMHMASFTITRPSHGRNAYLCLFVVELAQLHELYIKIRGIATCSISVIQLELWPRMCQCHRTM